MDSYYVEGDIEYDTRGRWPEFYIMNFEQDSPDRHLTKSEFVFALQKQLNDYLSENTYLFAYVQIEDGDVIISIADH